MVKQNILITGVNGRIGTRLAKHFLKEGIYHVIGIDRQEKSEVPINKYYSIDLKSDQSVADFFEALKQNKIKKLDSVIHLAAYYSFTDGNPELYDQITVKGTERILAGIQNFECDQFIFSSTQLVHAPVQIGDTINEDSPIVSSWGYPLSKVQTEELIHKKRGKVPALILRICGCYDLMCHSIPISNQISRIYEKQIAAPLFPGDVNAGAPFIHFDDLTAAFSTAVHDRVRLAKEYSECTLILGEDSTVGYDRLQRVISRELFGKEMRTFRIPKWFAKMGAFLQNKIPFLPSSFIKPWMIDLADNHYALDISKAADVLKWKPKKGVEKELLKMVQMLKNDPEKWYQENGINPPSSLKKRWARGR